MWVGDEFPNDNNQALKNVQFDLYGALMGYLYSYARERYLNAVRLVGIDTELAAIVRDKQSFDHRVLQDAHDRIAAFYRFAHDDGGQLGLGMDFQKYEDALREKWSSFLHEETRSLAQNDAINLAILGAAAYQNTEQGYAHEGRLLELLRERYGDLSRPRAKDQEVKEPGQ